MTTYRAFRMVEPKRHGDRVNTILLTRTDDGLGWYALTETPTKFAGEPVTIRVSANVHEEILSPADLEENHQGTVTQLLEEDGATEIPLADLGCTPEEHIARCRRRVPRWLDEDEAEAAVERLSESGAYHRD
jgi:hypothetical protein